jgi:hypothetical protein
MYKTGSSRRAVTPDRRIFVAIEADGDGSPAVPAVYRGTEGRPGPVLFTLDVDGERFAIRRAGDGGTAYDWLSGPNKGYGFGSSGTPNRPMEEHRESIRAFLAMIDPNTGYIGDD